MAATPDPSDTEIVAALADPLRGSLYRYVRSQRGPVTRDEAAREAGISNKLAAFHLDKLVQLGVLDASYERQPGPRRRGRAPKVYEPSGRSLLVSIPERRYDLAGEVLLDAVIATPEATRAVGSSARLRGQGIGASARRRHRLRKPDTPRCLHVAAEVLDELGYEPVRAATDPDSIWLRNCPFDHLVCHDRDTVCGLNQALVGGILDGIGGTGLEAALVPRPDRCCVEIRPSRPRS